MIGTARQIDEYFPASLLTRFGTSVEDAAKSARDAVARYVAALESLDVGVLTTPVAAGKWSPTGFTEHLLLTTEIYRDDISRVVGGGGATHHDRGFVDADGNMVVTVPGAAPKSNEDVSDLVRDLRSATETLIDHVRAVDASERRDVIVHVNPYFGELTALGCLQLAAAHAHHHRKRHLAALAPT